MHTLMCVDDTMCNADVDLQVWHVASQKLQNFIRIKGMYVPTSIPECIRENIAYESNASKENKLNKVSN